MTNMTKEKMKIWPIKLWNEDLSDCIFFHFNNFEEPPVVYCGSPLEIDFNSEYWTHFVIPDFNNLFDQVQEK